MWRFCGCETKHAQMRPWHVETWMHVAPLFFVNYYCHHMPSLLSLFSFSALFLLNILQYNGIGNRQKNVRNFVSSPWRGLSGLVRFFFWPPWSVVFCSCRGCLWRLGTSDDLNRNTKCQGCWSENKLRSQWWNNGETMVKRCNHRISSVLWCFMTWKSIQVQIFSVLRSPQLSYGPDGPASDHSRQRCSATCIWKGVPLWMDGLV